MSLGQRIAERLTDIKISQSELARRARVPQSTMNGLIHGDYRWSPHLPRIAQVLGTTPAFLVGETDDAAPDATVETTLSSDEQELLDHYRAIEAKERAAIMTLARSLATNARSPTVHSKGQQFRGASTAAGGGPK